MTAPPVLVAAACLFDGDRVLLTQRPAKGHLASLWEFPGGKVEAGEDPRDAVVRELREECGVEVEVEDILDVTFHRYPKKDVLLLFYAGRIVSGEVQHREVAAHAWVRDTELDDYALPPADGPVVAKVRARLRSA